jgi:hypothetical protein
VTPHAPPEAQLDTERRGGLDGAGWFVAILVIALFYGLTISSLSGAADRATSDADGTVLPRPAVAFAVHGDPVERTGQP